MAAGFYGTNPDELDLTETPRCAEFFERDHQPGPYMSAVLLLICFCAVQSELTTSQLRLR